MTEEEILKQAVRILEMHLKEKNKNERKSEEEKQKQKEEKRKKKEEKKKNRKPGFFGKFAAGWKAAREEVKGE